MDTNSAFVQDAILVSIVCSIARRAAGGLRQEAHLPSPPRLLHPSLDLEHPPEL